MYLIAAAAGSDLEVQDIILLYVLAPGLAANGL